MKMTKQHRPSRAYLFQSRNLLKNSFVDISDSVIEHIFNQRSNLNFTEAYRHLAVINNDAGSVLEDAPHLHVLRKHPRRKVKLSIDNDDLTDEISMIPELIQKPASKPNEVIVLSDSEDEDEDMKPAARPKEAIELLDSDTEDEEKEEDSVECKVCYADYEASEIYSCAVGEDHAVCKTCIGRFVSEQLHGNDSVKFKCIGDVDCECEYSLALLEKVLPEDLNRQVTERTFHVIAQIEGMWQCPEGCGYVGFVDEQFPWVECPNCNKQYCTSCNEPMHHTQTCNEVRLEKERMKDPRHKAHEAMSQACKRFCPHCDQEYMKSDGCNKITCSKCKKFSCYLCGVKIVDYSHFCNHSAGGAKACKCGKKCMLWTSTEAMEKIDRAKRQEAGRKILLEAGVTDEETIIDILGSPPAKLMAKSQDKIGTPQRVLRDRGPAVPVLSPPPNDPDVRHERNADARLQADREPESPDEFFSPRPNANARPMDRELFDALPQRVLFDHEAAAPAALSPRPNVNARPEQNENDEAEAMDDRELLDMLRRLRADHEPEAPAANLSPRPNANARPDLNKYKTRHWNLGRNRPEVRRRNQEVMRAANAKLQAEREPAAHAAILSPGRPEVNAVVRGGAPRLNVASPRQPRRHIPIAGVIKVSSREQDLHLRRQKREARPKPWQRDGVAPKAAARMPNIAPARRHMNQGPNGIVPPANRQNRVPNNTIGLAVAQRDNQTGFDNAEARDCLIM